MCVFGVWCRSDLSEHRILSFASNVQWHHLLAQTSICNIFNKYVIFLVVWVFYMRPTVRFTTEVYICNILQHNAFVKSTSADDNNSPWKRFTFSITVF